MTYCKLSLFLLISYLLCTFGTIPINTKKNSITKIGHSSDINTKMKSGLNRVIRSAMTTTHAKAIEQLENKLKATCLKYGDEGAYEKVMASYNESKNCLIKYRIFVTPYRVYRQNLDNCTAELRSTMKQCLNEEGKYYPDFILELLQSLFGFIYANANALLQSSRSSPNAELASCMRAINQQDAQMKIFKCLNDTYTADESNTNDVVAIPPKSQLCKRLKLADTCISTYIKDTCIRDIKITKLVNDVIAAVEAPCQDTTISETEN